MEQVVHVRICEAATGVALPCRLLFRDAHGLPRVPLGYVADPPVEEGKEVGGSLVAHGEVWAYTDGSCEVRLPPGRVTVRAGHGLMYFPLDEEEDRGQGRIAIRMAMRRAIEAKPGWCWADTRVHWLPPAAAALEGAAEGLDLVHLLAFRSDRPDLPRLPNLLDFSGQQILLDRYSCKVVVNTYHRGRSWGDLVLLHCHRRVFPLVIGESGFEHYTLSDWAYQCHRKGGLVVWPEFPGVMGERIVLALLGAIDAIEWAATAQVTFDAPSLLGLSQRNGDDSSNSTSLAGKTTKADSQWTGLALWYALLNSGRRLPIVGASGKRSNATAVGAIRTATYLGNEPLTPASWVAAVKHGRTFATRGPVLEWEILGSEDPWHWPVGHRSASPVSLPKQEGAALGSTCSPQAQPNEESVLHLRARACSVTPFTRLELVCGGVVIADAQSTVRESADNCAVTSGVSRSLASREGGLQSKIWQAQITWQIASSKLAQLPGNWLALRCWDEQGLAAHTSPIWLPSKPRMPREHFQLLQSALFQSMATLESTPHPRQLQLSERLQQARRALEQAYSSAST